MEALTAIQIIFLTEILLIILEFSYSRYKKDGVYSVNGTIGNMVSGLTLYIVLSPRTYVIFLIIFYKYYNIFHINLTYDFQLISFIFCLIFVDLMYYIFHHVHHRSKLLWSFHLVHHSDDHVNLSTAYRTSWFEAFYINIFFIPVLLVGFHPILIFTSYYIITLNNFICHSQYFKLPRFFDYIFMTPNNHRVHHDQELKYQHNNYGGLFSIWDRIFGTYLAEVVGFKAGIKDYKEDNFLKYQTIPVYNYIKNIWRK